MKWLHGSYAALVFVKCRLWLRTHFGVSFSALLRLKLRPLFALTPLRFSVKLPLPRHAVTLDPACLKV